MFFPQRDSGSRSLGGIVSAVVPIKLLNVNETAPMIGKTPASLRWMIHTGTAPKSALIGGRRMFRETDVIAWINAAFEESA